MNRTEGAAWERKTSLQLIAPAAAEPLNRIETFELPSLCPQAKSHRHWPSEIALATLRPNGGQGDKRRTPVLKVWESF